MSLQIWFCNPWESYLAQLEWESDQQQLEMEKEEDLDREAELASEVFASFGPDDSQDDGIDEPDDTTEPDAVVTDEDWPWYADVPLEIQEPEVIEC